MSKNITRSEAYKLWLDGNYDEVMPFEDKFSGFDFISKLHSRGIEVIKEWCPEADEYCNFITKDEMERYAAYKVALDRWESINGKVTDDQMIPLEIQQMNPFGSKQ